MKSGYVALIGVPNVGKSSLMNRLIGQKIAITSDRPQTTRDRIETVYTEDRGQIVFVDTPGIHRAKNKLGQYMDQVAERAFSDVDVILWLVEPKKGADAEEERIALLLKSAAKKKPVLLVINKCDQLAQKEAVREIAARYEGLVPFRETVPVSALTGSNTDTLLDSIFELLPEGPLFYDEETVTTIPLREIAEELIREQALRLLGDEIPHGIAVNVQKFSRRRPGLYDVEADIVCEKESHKGIIIGRGGSMIKEIGTHARAEIEDQLGEQINLKLFVKVRRNWRNNEGFIKSYGYDKKKR